MTPEEFQRATNVSRETLERLSTFADVLAAWQKRINLVAPSSLPDLWERHMLDSAQLVGLAPPAANRWIDLGSGGGFPGVVIAILRADEPDFSTHLVESNAKKCAFLREAARISGAPATVHEGRIEVISPLGGEVVTARACAPLADLIPFWLRHRTPGGVGLFAKGRNVQLELTAAKAQWTLDYDLLPSRTGSGGQILRFRSAKPRP